MENCLVRGLICAHDLTLATPACMQNLAENGPDIFFPMIFRPMHILYIQRISLWRGEVIYAHNVILAIHSTSAKFGGNWLSYFRFYNYQTYIENCFYYPPPRSGRGI